MAVAGFLASFVDGALGMGFGPTSSSIGLRRLGHASPRAALRYQHATQQRDEAIADGIDHILDAADGNVGGNVLRFREGTNHGP